MLNREAMKSGDIVKHFKYEMLSVQEKLQNKYLYRVIGVAQHTESSECYMVYQALYDDCKIYIRPLDMFYSEVDRSRYPKIVQKYRFEKIEEGEMIK